MTAPLFEVRGATVRYGSAEVLRSITLDLHRNEFVAIAGPNGAGKSTLLNLLAGLADPTAGKCRFEGRPASAWGRREFARKVAVVQQLDTPAFPFTAEQVVLMGRTPHRTGFYESEADHLAVQRALEKTETEIFRAREFHTLSGGERQRILLASALAQEAQVLLLDEPATHLDLQHQVALHKLLQELRRSGLLVVAVTHDLNLASAFADRIIVLSRGALRADGTPAEVLSTSMIQEVFEVPVEFHQGDNGQRWMVYGR